ncbi:MAG: efflux RND transporter permease subunit [Desulfobacteraceae bacterium]|nr:efflux RND transporter permease subunit [Desulfobacteraceae bacterium]
MRPVVRYSLKQTVFLNVLFVLLLIAGAFSIATSPVENMPLVDIGKVMIQTVYYGASAEDVEQLVTAKVEQALESLENVDFVQSDSYRNYSSVLVKFIDDSDYKKLYDELRFRVLNIKDELPLGADEPRFLYIDTNMWLPVIIVNISGDLPQRSLERYADELRTRLINVSEVRDVNIAGEYDHEFHVSLDPERLRRYGVTFTQVASAIKSANTKIPSGRFRTGDTGFMLNTGLRLTSQTKTLDIVVRLDGDGNFIRVRDLVTTVRLAHRDPRNIISVNGYRAVRLVVTKELNGNSLKIGEQIRQACRQFEKQHANSGIKLDFTNDSTIEINDSVNTLGGNLLFGMILVTGVLWLTLGFRNALLTAIGIPFSFLCAIIIMKLAGVTINTISLFAFVLVTGIIVDDAVIIIENTFRHIQMGKTRRQAIIDGTGEVMLPIISSAMTTILAFVPMLIMTGSTGDFFSIIPKTVTYALFASLFEALFILPIHIWDWGPRYAGGYAGEGENEEQNFYAHLKSGIFGYLWPIYKRIASWLLDHKVITFSGITLIFGIALTILLLSISGIMPLIEVKFFPGNYFRYHVTIENAADTSIERTDAIVRDISRFIMTLGPGQAQAAAGDAGYYEDQDYVRHRGGNFGQIVVTLPELKNRNFPGQAKDPIPYLGHIRKLIVDYAQDAYENDPARPRVNVFEESDGPPTGKPVNIRITGLTMEDVIQASDHLLTFMRKAPGLNDLIQLTDNRPNLYRTVYFTPRQEAVYEHNLAADQITALVAGALNGMQAGPYRILDDEVDLVVRIARKDDVANISKAGLSEPGDIMSIPVIEDSAAPIYVRDLVTADFGMEPNVRSRYQGKPSITITADLVQGSALNPAAVRLAVDSFYKKHMQDLFAGIALSYGGEFESTSKSFVSLFIAFIIAIMAIYMVLATQFRDYFQPFLILTAVPFALIGVTMGLFFSRTVFTVGSFIATVGLSGVAVNNTLLLIDFMNKRLRLGKPLRQAILEACAARMRPVIITTVTTTLGLLPMAIGIPHKSISWSPMATAFVTGLSCSTVLALLITPANYEFLSQIRSRIKQRKFKLLRKRKLMERELVKKK